VPRLPGFSGEGLCYLGNVRQRAAAVKGNDKRQKDDAGTATAFEEKCLENGPFTPDFANGAESRDEESRRVL